MERLSRDLNALENKTISPNTENALSFTPKKNRNTVYNGMTCNIMDVAVRYSGDYCMDFKDKSGRKVHCKMSCIPIRMCYTKPEPACNAGSRVHRPDRMHLQRPHFPCEIERIFQTDI